MICRCAASASAGSGCFVRAPARLRTVRARAQIVRDDRCRRLASRSLERCIALYETDCDDDRGWSRVLRSMTAAEGVNYVDQSWGEDQTEQSRARMIAMAMRED